MSTLTYLTDDNVVADRELPDREALTTFWENPEAVLDTIYGPTRRIIGATPAHNHDQDGGESLLLPIVEHSFGSYNQLNEEGVGIPLGRPSTGTFAPVTTNGVTDKTGAKRIYCVGAVLPGGVLGVKVSVTTWHAAAGASTTLTVAIRHLSSVNYKLGIAPEECSADISFTTVGANQWVYRTAEIADLSILGDPTRNREVEISLWLTSDVHAVRLQRVWRFGVRPRYFTPRARRITSKDLTYPQLAARELKTGLGGFGGTLAGKLKEIFNALNRGLWGYTPGLLLDGTPDQRRRYLEEVTACHKHFGMIVPDGSGGVYSDGACLTDAQSFGFVMFLGETEAPPNNTTPPVFDHRPNQGSYLHFSADLSAGWLHYHFRRSIPAGCGALVLRVAVFLGSEDGLIAPEMFDKTLRLLVNVEATPVDGGDSIVTRVFCGPFSSILDSSSDDYRFCELEAEDDVAYVSNAALVAQGAKAWNRGAEVTGLGQVLSVLNTGLCRVSKEILAKLTYPPLYSEDTYRETGDYDVKLRCKLIDSAGLAVGEPSCQWILCQSAPGY